LGILMSLNSKFKPSFEEFETYLYKTLPNEEFDNLANKENSYKWINISAFIEFFDFESRNEFINSNLDENIKYIKEYSQLPIVLIEAPYEWFEKISYNDSIASIYGNHQVYLCLDITSSKANFKEEILTINGLTGKDVIIGLIDSGIDQTHPDLSHKIIKTYNVTGESNGDFNGHGTFMAGIIAGSRKLYNNHYYGIASESNLVDIKVFNKEGKATVAEMIEALDLILKDINEESPEIIVFGGTDWSFNEKSLIARYCEQLNKYNIVIVAPTGNFGPDLGNICSLGGDPNVLTVGASDNNQKLPFFSARHKGIDVILPGIDVISAKSQNNLIGKSVKNEPKYTKLSGTSISAAIAGGFLALLKESDQNLTPLQLYKLFKTHTKKLSGFKYLKKIMKKIKLEQNKIPDFSFSSILKISVLVSMAIFVLFLILFYLI
ncbi:MAG: S8 family serine peptidase, partial [Promethearchaeota archaeon]